MSAEVISTDFNGIIKEGDILAKLHPQIVVKVPMIRDGVKALAPALGKLVNLTSLNLHGTVWR